MEAPAFWAPEASDCEALLGALFLIAFDFPPFLAPFEDDDLFDGVALAIEMRLESRCSNMKAASTSLFPLSHESKLSAVPVFGKENPGTDQLQYVHEKVW